MKRKFRTTLKINLDVPTNITSLKESLEDWKKPLYYTDRKAFHLIKLYDPREDQYYIEFFVCISPLFFIKGILI